MHVERIECECLANIRKDSLNWINLWLYTFFEVARYMYSIHVQHTATCTCMLATYMYMYM